MSGFAIDMTVMLVVVPCVVLVVAVGWWLLSFHLRSPYTKTGDQSPHPVRKFKAGTHFLKLLRECPHCHTSAGLELWQHQVLGCRAYYVACVHCGRRAVSQSEASYALVKWNREVDLLG
jgi:Zn ribbon nucleic-acid-binding protein